MENNWLAVWGQTHICLSLFYYPKKQRTYRLIINSAASGGKIRLTLSNTCGKNDVEIGCVTVACCNKNGRINADSDIKICTYNGSKKILIKKGERITLDEVGLECRVGSYICISAFVSNGDLSSGNLMNNAVLLTADGDCTKSLGFENKKRPRDGVIKFASSVTKLPLHRPIPLFETIEVCNNENAKAVVVFGDSLSQQGFWTNPFEKRLREAFEGKYTLINKSAMGNRILRDCSPRFILRNLYGKRAVERIKEDVLCYENISHVIMFIGINDIIQYGTLDAYKSEKPEMPVLYAAIKGMAQEIRSKGIKLMIFTIPAFGAAANGSKEKDSLRRELNKWIKNNERLFDGVFDCAEILKRKDDDYYISPELLGGDKMHINALGGDKIANSVTLDFFE